MKNDLSNVRAGDWIWATFDGWIEVKRIDHSSPWPIKAGEYSYTLDGKHRKSNKYPSAFTEPPDCFNAEPKPCEFNKGDRVLVRDDKCGMWHRKYFSHMNDDGLYVCFRCDHDGWSSYGRCKGWEQCKKWEEGK